jgi:molybdopterin molybdotransferase
MMSFDEALNAVLALARPLGAETITLYEAHGRVLAAPVIAGRAAPAADLSAMDGYAVRESDLVAPEVRLRVIGEAVPGRDFAGDLPQGCCVRIFTGAALPSGADRVIIQEEVRRVGADIMVSGAARGRRHIRKAGSDFPAGAVLVEAGLPLTATRMVALAAADISEVLVVRRPRISLIATGDELREPGVVGDGVPDSVSFGVAALAQDWGGVIIGRTRCPDVLATLEQAAACALAEADIVVVSGGASVGDHDFARKMFATSGLVLSVDKVAMKPGKPVWIGQAANRIVVGLPGNPTSALVTARLLLAPLVAQMAGRGAEAACRWTMVDLTSDLAEAGERETFVRAVRGPDGVTPIIDQDAAAQAALAQCDALVHRRPGQSAATAGQPVPVLQF